MPLTCWGHKTSSRLTQINSMKIKDIKEIVSSSSELEDSPRESTYRALATKLNVFFKRTYKIE